MSDKSPVFRSVVNASLAGCIVHLPNEITKTEKWIPGDQLQISGTGSELKIVNVSLQNRNTTSVMFA